MSVLTGLLAMTSMSTETSDKCIRSLKASNMRPTSPKTTQAAELMLYIEHWALNYHCVMRDAGEEVYL